jgi:predicted porin
MKKTIAMACTLLAAAGASAQTTVTVYGILDAAIDYNTNVDTAGHSRVWMPDPGGGMFPSRLGFKGTEDLGGGLKAIFTLENGFGVDTGVNGQNRLFGRQAWVGLAGDWGQLTLGRNYNMIYNSMFEVDLVGPSNYGLGAIDPAIPNGRSDNSIAYKGKFGALTVGATYSLGRDTSAAGGPSGTNCAGERVGDAQACREWSAMVRYDAPRWGLVGAYDRVRGGAGAAAGLVRSDLTDSRANVGGYVRIDKVKLAGGTLVRNNEGSATTPRSNLVYLEAAYYVSGNVTIDGEIARLDYKDSINDTKQGMVRIMVDLSKRTTVYAVAGHIANHGTAAIALSAGSKIAAGEAQSGVMLGLKHSF